MASAMLVMSIVPEGCQRVLVLVFVPNTKWLKEADVRTATYTRIAIESVEDNAAVLLCSQRVAIRTLVGGTKDDREVTRQNLANVTIYRE